MPPKRKSVQDTGVKKKQKTEPKKTTAVASKGGKTSSNQEKAQKMVEKGGGDKQKQPKKSKPDSLDSLPTTPPTNSWLFKHLSDPGWKNKLAPCFHTDKFKQMETWLTKQYATEEVFPAKELIFNAFNLTPFDKVKVVILGQDPYHDNGQAHGLSFSVPKGVDVPPSLKNIYKELLTDIAGFKRPDHGCLEKWARDGVLLLNAALTVQAHQANSHARCGWWEFTDNVIRTLSQHADSIVFILWGNWAQKKELLIETPKHIVIKTAHPSPLSFNKFSGCKCFSKANDALVAKGLTPIDWKVE